MTMPDEDLPTPSGGDAGPVGGFDFGAILEQAGQVQAQLMAAQQQAAATVVTGVAGGGAVKVDLTGAFEFQAVTIAPDAVDPDDVEMLQDLVLAALRDGAEQVQRLQAGGLDLGELDLGGLFGGS
jgi:DNA-binding YbaB/EbfC family protein